MSTPMEFDARSPRNDLPYLFVAQAQKEATVNEALARIDTLLRPVVDGESDTPPADPAEGSCWIVGEGAQGAWTGREGSLAFHVAGAWMYALPAEGTLVFDRAQGVLRHWREDWQTMSLPTVPTGGTTIDTQARVAIETLIEQLRAFGLGSGE